jgi:hypothetical protein
MQHDFDCNILLQSFVCSIYIMDPIFSKSNVKISSTKVKLNFFIKKNNPKPIIFNTNSQYWQHNKETKQKTA